MRGVEDRDRKCGIQQMWQHLFDVEQFAVLGFQQQGRVVGLALDVGSDFCDKNFPDFSVHRRSGCSTCLLHMGLQHPYPLSREARFLLQSPR
jgi:hypothetical protein